MPEAVIVSTARSPIGRAVRGSLKDVRPDDVAGRRRAGGPGQGAENVATLRGVSRADRDSWGVESQNRAEKAIADGFFAREITPRHHARRHRRHHGRRPRAGVTVESVSGLRTVSGRTAPSRRAAAARSTTAPRRSSS